MAKDSFPMMSTGRGILAKVVTTMVVLAVLVLVIKHPSEAAHAVTGIGHAAGSVVDGVSTFLQALAGR